MENKLKVVQEFANNSIDKQELSYANQLTVKQWNDIINILRIQTNNNTNYLRQLHSWIVGYNSSEDYAIIEDGKNLYQWIKDELQSFEDYVNRIKSEFVSVDNKEQIITGKKVFKHFVSDKILPETEYGILGDGYNNFSSAHIKEVITDSIVPIVNTTESGVSGNIGKDGLYWNEAFINGINATTLNVQTITLDGDDLKAWTTTHVQTKIAELRKELYEIDSDGVIDSILEITKALEEGGDYYQVFINKIEERALITDFEDHKNVMNQLFAEHIAEFEDHLTDSNNRIEEVNTNIEMHRQNKEWIVDAEGKGSWVTEDNPHDVDKGQMPLFDTWADNVDGTLFNHQSYINLNNTHRNTKGNPHNTEIDDIDGLRDALEKGTKGNELIKAHMRNEVDDDGEILPEGTKNNNPHKVTHEQVIGLTNRLTKLEEDITAKIKDGELSIKVTKGDNSSTDIFTANQEHKTAVVIDIPNRVTDLSDHNEYAKKTDIGDGLLSFQINGEELADSFRANSPDNITVNIPVPTKVTDLEDHTEYAKKTDIGEGKLKLQVNNKIISEDFNANSKEDVSINIEVPTKVTDLEDADMYPRLDSNKLIPKNYLPSYVDDVLEFSTHTEFPTTGEDGKIYVDKSTNLTYRWTGTQYIQIGGSDTTELEEDLKLLEGRVDQLEEDVEDINDRLDNLNIGNGKITIAVNEQSVGDFNLNQNTSETIHISVPTDNLHIGNGRGYITAKEIPSEYVTDGELKSALVPYTTQDQVHTADIEALKKAINDLIGGDNPDEFPDDIEDLDERIGKGNLHIYYGDTSNLLDSFNANAKTDVSIIIPEPDIIIPEVGNGTLTITYDSQTLGTFTANSFTNKNINIPKPNITIPTEYVKENDNITRLNNNAGYITWSSLDKDLSKYDNSKSGFLVKVPDEYVTSGELKTETETGIINTAIDGKVAALRKELYEVDSDSVLDSIMEISNALKNDPNVITALEQSISNKMDKLSSVTTNTIVRVDNQGNSKTSTASIDDSGYITAAGYKVPSGTNESVLLAGGSTKPLSDFLQSADYNAITLTLNSNSEATLSTTQLSVLKANPHKIVFVIEGFYYFAENLSSTSVWYYSCNVYYSNANIIKRVVSVDTTSGLCKKADYTYTPPTANDATINIMAGKGLIAGGSFTTDQADDEDIVLNVSSSTLNVTDDSVDLSTSGVTAGTYGTDQTPSHSGTFNIPKITVDKYGRVTDVSTATITLPADKDTDSDQKTSSAATTDKIYLVGAKEKSSGGVTTNTNDGVYAMNNGVLGSKQVRVDSSTTGSTKACTMQYDDSINALKFVFT